MRLWWNQSLASCGWWLVGDPSVRPSVHTSIRETFFPRHFANRDPHRSRSPRPRRDRSSPTRRCARRGENFGADNWTPGRVYRPTVWLSVSWTLFEGKKKSIFSINRKILANVIFRGRFGINIFLNGNYFGIEN